MKLQSASPAALTLPLEDALLRAAGRLAKTPDKSLASQIYQSLANQSKRPLVRRAGLRGLLLLEPEQALVRLLAALRSSPGEEQPLIAQLVVDLPARQDCAELVKVLPELPAAAQIVLLGAFTERKELAAKPVITRIAQSAADLEVRRAAWDALAALSSSADVRFLAEAAAAGDEPTRPMAAAPCSNWAVTTWMGPLRRASRRPIRPCAWN